MSHTAGSSASSENDIGQDEQPVGACDASPAIPAPSPPAKGPNEAHTVPNNGSKKEQRETTITLDALMSSVMELFDTLICKLNSTSAAQAGLVQDETHVPTATLVEQDPKRKEDLEQLVNDADKFDKALHTRLEDLGGDAPHLKALVCANEVVKLSLRLMSGQLACSNQRDLALINQTVALFRKTARVLPTMTPPARQEIMRSWTALNDILKPHQSPK